MSQYIDLSNGILSPNTMGDPSAFLFLPNQSDRPPPPPIYSPPHHTQLLLHCLCSSWGPSFGLKCVPHSLLPLYTAASCS